MKTIWKVLPEYPYSKVRFILSLQYPDCSFLWFIRFLPSLVSSIDHKRFIIKIISFFTLKHLLKGFIFEGWSFINLIHAPILWIYLAFVYDNFPRFSIETSSQIYSLWDLKHWFEHQFNRKTFLKHQLKELPMKSLCGFFKRAADLAGDLVF